ncbi:MAG: hypothetical protein ACXWB9_04105, partial [Flavisolibacter sp.]
FRKFFEGETDQLPEFYLNLIKKDLGIWYKWLPEGAIMHDQNAYLKKSVNKVSNVARPGMAAMNVASAEKVMVNREA